eukprot:s2541_g15.t1
MAVASARQGGGHLAGGTSSKERWGNFLVKDFTKKTIPDTQRMFFALSLGKLEKAPFSDAQMEELRRQWFQMLPSPAEASKVPDGQPFFLHALAQMARKMGDEDADILDSGEDNYVDGRWVGYKHVFPRVPLVFRPKVKERQYDDSEYNPENSNYGSAKEYTQQIETQFVEEEKLGFMFPLSEAEARKRYGDKLRIAALGAIPKDDGRVRVIFDATHFVQINNHIVIQDKLEFPGPEASATLMDVTLSEGSNTEQKMLVCLAAGLSPTVQYGLTKWGHLEWLACAAYHFARLASLVGRLVMRLTGQAHVFQLLFADDLKMVAAGPDKYDQVWHMLIAWIMFGAPFRWPKFRGGVCLEFVGFFMDYCKFEVGLSERRSNWIVQWIREAQANQGVVAHRSFVELVGRLVYASQVLTWLRSFLSPLHAWKAAIAPGTVATMPRMVSVVLLFISSMLQDGYHRTSGKSPTKKEGQAFRTDAKCEEGRVVLGGWETGRACDPSKARWFALEVLPGDAPWLFEKEKVEAMSTTAELLASLVALEVFGFFEGKAPPSKVLVEAGTDNLATEHISHKDASNKFPLALVQAQLALKCFLYGIVFRLEWRPRETNVEADALTNLDFGKFDLNLRQNVRWSDLDWKLLEKLLSFRDEVRRNKDALLGWFSDGHAEEHVDIQRPLADQPVVSLPVHEVLFARDLLSNCDSTGIVLPWETGSFRELLSDDPFPMLVPKVHVSGLIDHGAGDAPEKIAEELANVASSSDSRPACASLVSCVDDVNFLQRRQDLRNAAIWKLLHVIRFCLQASSTGRNIMELGPDMAQSSEAFDEVSAVVGVKSPATLIKRANSLLSFLRWVARFGNPDSNPCVEPVIWKYLCHLKETQAPATPGATVMTLCALPGMCLDLTVWILQSIPDA